MKNKVVITLYLLLSLQFYSLFIAPSAVFAKPGLRGNVKSALGAYLPQSGGGADVAPLVQWCFTGGGNADPACRTAPTTAGFPNADGDSTEIWWPGTYPYYEFASAHTGGFGCGETGHTVTGISGQRGYNGTFSVASFAVPNNSEGWISAPDIIYTPPFVEIKGCFKNKQDGSSIAGNEYPAVIIKTVGALDETTTRGENPDPKNTPDRELRITEQEIDVNGCFSNSTFVRKGEKYSVEAESVIIPLGYIGPAYAYNTSAYNHGTGAMTGWNDLSFQNQIAGDRDCGVWCDFAFEAVPLPTIPDCTNLAGPTQLEPNQSATYTVTAGGNAPITGVGLSAYKDSCSNDRSQYSQDVNPQAVSGAGSYQFNFTAPNVYGTYTLYGRVWNDGIAECKADCVDAAPRYLCAGAQLCKKQVVVAPIPSGTYSVACRKDVDTTYTANQPLEYTHTISSINNQGVGNFTHSEVWLSFSGNQRNDAVKAFLGEPTLTLPASNWYGYRLHRFSSWSGTGSLSTNLSSGTRIGFHAGAKTIGQLADQNELWMDNGILTNAKYTVVANLLMAGKQNDGIGSKSIEILPTTCAITTPQTITITGTIREGTAQKYGPNNYCADTSKPPIAIQGTVSLSGTPLSTYNLGGSSSTFSFPITVDPAGTKRTLSLSGLTNTICACEGVGCNYTIPTDTPGTYSYDFFVAKYTDQSWWQTSGGHIYAGGGMASVIPATCKTPGCNPFLVLLERYPYTLTQKHPLSAGIPITPSTLETGSADITERPEPNTSAKLTSVPTISPKENYDYFAQKVALETIPNQATTTITDLSQLSATNRDGVLIAKFPGALLLAPAATWTIPGGAASTAKKYILFADSATIADEHDLKKLITVEEGGYFMLITKGAITIADSVGDLPSNKTVNVEGVYVAGGNLTIEGDGDQTTQDLQFTGAGTFVGWSNITMYRQYKDNAAGSLLNNTVPSEFFIFRPDLVRSAPDILKDSQTVWKEIK